MAKYFTNPDWEFEKVNRASLACGPMVKWARAQISYADMLHKVDPLRNELKRLKKTASDTKARGAEVTKVRRTGKLLNSSYRKIYLLEACSAAHARTGVGLFDV